MKEVRKEEGKMGDREEGGREGRKIDERIWTNVCVCMSACVLAVRTIRDCTYGVI